MSFLELIDRQKWIAVDQYSIHTIGSVRAKNIVPKRNYIVSVMKNFAQKILKLSSVPTIMSTAPLSTRLLGQIVRREIVRNRRLVPRKALIIRLLVDEDDDLQTSIQLSEPDWIKARFSLINATRTFEIAYKILSSDQYFVSITPDRGYLKPKEEIEIVAKIPTRLLATRAAIDFKQDLIVFYTEAIERSNPPDFVDDLRLEILFFDYCRTKKLAIDFKSEEYKNSLEKRNIKAYIHFPIN